MDGIKTILTLRHSFKNPGGGDVALSVKGQEFALAIGRRMADFYAFDILMGSDQIRTTQTGILILAGMGKAVDKIVQSYGLCGPSLSRWKEVIPDKDAVLPEGITLLGSVLVEDPTFYTLESRRVSDVYRKQFADMEDGQTALIIGHSPIIEMAVSALVEDDPNEHPALEECAGYELTMQAGVIHAKNRLFLPGP